MRRGLAGLLPSQAWLESHRAFLTARIVITVVITLPSLLPSQAWLEKYGMPPVLPDLKVKLERGMGFFGEGSTARAANPPIGLVRIVHEGACHVQLAQRVKAVVAELAAEGAKGAENADRAGCCQGARDSSREVTGGESSEDVEAGERLLLELGNSDTGDGRGRNHFQPLATVTVRRAGTSKATALEHVMTLLSATGSSASRSSDCWAFGDGDNDVEMLRWAGWSVSPSNATESAQAAAKAVSLRSHDEDFIAHELQAALLPRVCGTSSL